MYLSALARRISSAGQPIDASRGYLRRGCRRSIVNALNASPAHNACYESPELPTRKHTGASELLSGSRVVESNLCSKQRTAACQMYWSQAGVLALVNLRSS